jgi:hypothetical protein
LLDEPQEAIASAQQVTASAITPPRQAPCDARLGVSRMSYSRRNLSLLGDG